MHQTVTPESLKPASRRSAVAFDIDSLELASGGRDVADRLSVFPRALLPPVLAKSCSRLAGDVSRHAAGRPPVVQRAPRRWPVCARGKEDLAVHAPVRTCGR